jgi:hypothetical protein
VLAGPNEAQRAVALLTARIERLIADLPTPTRLRRHAEVGIAVAVLAAGTSAALTVPAWIATDFKADSLSFLVLSAPAETEVEAPAFATFRALAPAVAATSSGAPLDEHQPALPPPSASCTCVETQAELAAGVAAIGPPASQRLGWGSPDRHAWEVRRPEDDGPMQTARPLWTLSDSQTQLGFFVVSGPTP